MMEVCSTRFPHSDISGSMDICSSPKLFAAYHVFHRLLVPRHPPCALISLTFWFIALNHRAVFTRVIFRYLFLVNCFGYDFLFASPAFLPLRQILNHITSDVLIFSYHRIFNMQFSRYMVHWANALTLNIAFALSHTQAFVQMEMERFELLTPCLQGRCSPN